MRLHRKILILLATTALMVSLAVAPGQNGVALAQAASVTYNLYATDGYVSLADGAVAYIYGFVGGPGRCADLSEQLGGTSWCRESFRAQR